MIDTDKNYRPYPEDTGVKYQIGRVRMSFAVVSLILCGIIAGVSAGVKINAVTDMSGDGNILIPLCISAAKYAFVISLCILCLKYHFFTILMGLYTFCGSIVTGFFSCQLIRINTVALLTTALPAAIYLYVSAVLLSEVIYQLRDKGNMQFNENGGIMTKTSGFKNALYGCARMIAVGVFLEGIAAPLVVSNIK